MVKQCNGGAKRYGALDSIHALHSNLRGNCVPEVMWNGDAMEYDAFLEERRKLMAAKMKAYFQTL